MSFTDDAIAIGRELADRNLPPATIGPYGEELTAPEGGLPVGRTLSMAEAVQLWADGVIREHTVPRLNLGIPLFDRPMRGLQNGEVVAFLGRTGSRKTQLTTRLDLSGDESKSRH